MTRTRKEWFAEYYAANDACVAALETKDMEAYRVASIRHDRALDAVMGRPIPPQSPEFIADWTDPADAWPDDGVGE